MSRKAKFGIAQAAAEMGVTQQFLRLALQRKELPFGVAVRMNKRWVYYINPERFRRWMAGEDMGGDGDAERRAGA